LYVVCSADIVALCYAGVSYLQGGGGAMGELGNDWQLMYRKTCTVVRSTAVRLMLCHDTVEFIGSRCRFCVDWIISYCLRIYMKICKEFVSFPFLTKCEVYMIRSAGPNKFPVSCRRFASVEFEFQYLKN